ncbi:unnamed protein product [Cladocopium goreaui]|uniref:E3 ubiquitin-protein ligase HACE1 n=1 Tax=Cladocopium goreaui TaxID=2562237 RepID=A0A9P1CFK1_9DINO|nr:unnamed protein product [Cladocopium goreaui]
MASVADKGTKADAAVRKRQSSPASRKDVSGSPAEAKSLAASTKKEAPKRSMLDVVEGFPPQLCALALGSAGLARAWVLGGAAPALPQLWCLVAAGFLAIYGMKVALRWHAFLRDASEPPTLAALSGAPAAIQVLVVRLRHQMILDLLTTQCLIFVCHVLLLCTAVRFALLNRRKGLLPDPSWFPGLLLFGMTNISASLVGPEWLKALSVPWSFWLTIVIYLPVKLIVIYRLFLWSQRRSVTPNAGMATFMAPASFFTVVHLSIGKPGGDLVGLAIFADSTISFWMTLVLLWLRRSLWATSFHPSFVSFTFPLASTATAALLAQVHLPSVSSPMLEIYGKVLLYVSTMVILAVQLRFVYFLVELRQKQK